VKRTSPAGPGKSPRRLREKGAYFCRWRAGGDGILFHALGEESRPAHLLRAMLEGLTLEINAALKRAAQAIRVELSNLTVLGGGTRNALMRQLKADASGKFVRNVSEPECMARGAAMLAGIGAGIYEDYDSIPGPKYEPYTHSPSGNQAVYEPLSSAVLSHYARGSQACASSNRTQDTPRTPYDALGIRLSVPAMSRTDRQTGLA
jgi:sugar (pentulose or hexulose) kinase